MAVSYTHLDVYKRQTQDRQDALYELLKNPLDVMFVVGGYNLSLIHL